MLIGYNEATSLKNSSLDTDVAMCAKHGFDGLEMQTELMDKYMGSHSLDDLKALFKGSGVKSLPINALTEFNERGREEKLRGRLRYLCQCAQATGSDSVIMVPAPQPQGEPPVTREDTIRVLRDYMQIAAEYGLEIALEFLGFPDNTVNTLEEAVAIADCVDGLKLVLDCAHIMTSATDKAAILKLSPDRIKAVHINDIRE